MIIVWLYGLIVAAVLSAVVYTLTEHEALSVFFFMATFVLLGAFVLLLIKTMVEFLDSRKQETDLWMLGFIGVLGFLGFYKTQLVGLFGFFGFFGLINYKKKKRGGK